MKIKKNQKQPVAIMIMVIFEWLIINNTNPNQKPEEGIGMTIRNGHGHK